ncbi:Isovaleryl-homoserine lactone synthase [Jannaschia seosinensis]|uniref:Acyl-homoserine-lactone synthase n=1 Tax=Jannaschia seosinensis TaxID=313367 RepID=A0A0M7B9X2_9RHOB|nr:acyl-homoserine-lactone synthase [Jannaschia seosinensis]CUH38868.1 Isovaleryl-homoserine lactone synthase [Jannaschia seosinensis]
MIRYLHGSALHRHADLAASMFVDRATQFRDRMKWDVKVDALGWETDQYDVLDPIYVIAEDAAGRHAGSMRFLPTTGRTMLDEIFPHLKGGRTIRSPLIWECTRFCLSPGAGADVARLMLVGAQELGLTMGFSHSVGVFDRPMVRVYRRLGWEPEVLGSQDGISAGIWQLSRDVQDKLCEAAGLHPRLSRHWCETALADLERTVALPIGA